MVLTRKQQEKLSRTFEFLVLTCARKYIPESEFKTYADVKDWDYRYTIDCMIAKGLIMYDDGWFTIEEKGWQLLETLTRS